MMRPLYALLMVAGAGCSTGSVLDSDCPPGSIACDDGCCDVCAEHRHCPSGEYCCSGFCSADCDPCPDGGTVCGNTCRNLNSDFAACGDCATDCAAYGDAADTCRGGQCVCGTQLGPCAAGLTCCGGACVDLASSPHHCGECGDPCTNGQICIEGECAEDSADACGDLERCDEGLGYFRCADTGHTLEHCGDGGFDCSVEYGDAVDACMFGHCVCATQGSACTDGQRCDAELGCVAIQDPDPDPDPDPTCGPDNCSGCCNGDTCADGDDAGACGSGAAACVDCTSAYGNRANGCDDGQCICLHEGSLCPTEQQCTSSGCACIFPNTDCGSVCCTPEQTCVGGNRCESLTLGSATLSPSTLTLPNSGCTPTVVDINFSGTTIPSSTVTLVEVGGRALPSPMPVFGNWSGSSFSFSFDLCWDTTEACITDGTCSYDGSLAVSYIYRVTPQNQPLAAAEVVLKVVPAPQLTLSLDQVTWVLPDSADPVPKTHVFTVRGAPADRDIGILQFMGPTGVYEPPLRLDNDACATCAGEWREDANVYTFGNEWTACVKPGIFWHRVTDIYGRTAEAYLESEPDTPKLHVSPSSWAIPLHESTTTVEFRLGGTNRDASSTVTQIRGPAGNDDLDLKDLGAYWDSSRCNVLVVPNFPQKPYSRSGVYEYEACDYRGQCATTTIRRNRNSNARMTINVDYSGNARVSRPMDGCVPATYVFSLAGEAVEQSAGVVYTGYRSTDGSVTGGGSLDLTTMTGYWGGADAPNDFTLLHHICADSNTGYYTYEMYDYYGNAYSTELEVY